MKYFEMFTGIAGFSKGIEQAYGDGNQYESEESEQANCESGRIRVTNERRGDVRVADDAAFRRNAACIGFSEIAKTPSAVLRYRYLDIRNYGDASRIVCDELPDFDFLVGGFPCQAFSIAGKRKGFEDVRGTLFFEIARILQAKRPGHFLLENVAGLLSHDDGQTFRIIIATLDEIGYDLEWAVINSKDHGVPQNRERVFIVGHLRGGGCGQVFSIGESDGEFDEAFSDTAYCLDANYWKGCNDLNRNSRTIVDGAGSVTVGTLCTHKDGEGFREMQSGVAPSLNARARQDGSQQGVVMYSDRVNDADIAHTLKSRNDSGRGSKHSQTGGVVAVTERRTDEAKRIRRESMRNGRDFSPRRGKEVVARSDNLGNTVTATPSIEMAVTDHQRIRRLTPTECMRLQGFPDDWCDFGINEKGETYAISDTGKYQCAGNAVTVNVIEAIITRMLEEGCLS